MKNSSKLLRLIFKIRILFKFSKFCSIETANEIKNIIFYQKLFHKKRGLEIGGPSRFFRRVVLIYTKIKSLDGVNFSSSTIWEGDLTEGKHYKFLKRKKGYQFICDGVSLDRINSGTYDFVLSCNNLEHIANPLKATEEWLRVVKPNGLIFLVLPNKNSNFDHNRDITSFEHIFEDYNNNTSEDDLTHLDEIFTLHDLSMDLTAGDFEHFKNRSKNNFQNRCLHQHVFDMNLLEQIFQHLNIELVLCKTTITDFAILGRKCNSF